MRSVFNQVFRREPVLFLGIALCLVMGLAACGSASATSASATSTPNCTRGRLPQTATGTISNVTPTSFQLTDASGKATSVQVTSTTRITRIVAASAASLAPGAIVQIVPNAAGTTAQRILVMSQTGAGAGSGSGFRGGANGTPPAGFNHACAPTRTAGRGSFQGNQQGVRGTVASATSTQVVVSDPQGQTLTFAITPSTQILTSAAGSASDLSAGSIATVTGTLSDTTLVARTIVVQPAVASTS